MNSNYVFYKTDFTYQEFDVYYRKLIDTRMQEANNIFDDKHIYYYKSEFTEKLKLLGKYKGQTVRSSMYWNDYNYDYDYDYDVYEFINDKGEIEDVICREYNYIYCVGVPESSENMYIINGLFHNDSECFMKIA